jgi:hypothetical protein
MQEFEIGNGVAKMDVSDMIREMAAEQFELRPHFRTIAIANCETCFNLAIAQGKIGPALRALELHAKITGVLEAQTAEPAKPRVDLSVLGANERAQFRESLARVGQAQLAQARAEAQA